RSSRLISWPRDTSRAMAGENVELVREVNAVFNEAPGAIERWMPYYSRDAEFHMPPEWPEGRVCRGHDGISALANAWIGSFDEYRWDEARLIDESDCVVALWHHRGRARGTNGLGGRADRKRLVPARRQGDEGSGVLLVGRGPRGGRAAGVGELLGALAALVEPLREPRLGRGQVVDREGPGLAGEKERERPQRGPHPVLVADDRDALERGGVAGAKSGVGGHRIPLDLTRLGAEEVEEPDLLTARHLAAQDRLHRLLPIVVLDLADR